MFSSYLIYTYVKNLYCIKLGLKDCRNVKYENSNINHVLIYTALVFTLKMLKIFLNVLSNGGVLALLRLLH